MIENLYQDYFNLACQLANRLIQNENVSGICFLGGVGLRKKADRFSDIDIAVFIKDKRHGHFLPPFSFAVKYKDKLVEFNVSQHALNDPQNLVWDEARIAAYQNAYLYFDRNGAVEKLLGNSVYQASTNISEIVYDLNQAWWKGIYHSFAMIKRSDPIAANLLLNEALLLTIHTTNMLNGKHKIHTKWVASELYSSADNASNIRLIEESIRLPDMSEQSFFQRRSSFAKLYRSTLKKAREQLPHFPHSPYKYWAEHLSQRQIGNDSAINAVIKDCEKIEALSQLDRKRLHGALSFALFAEKTSIASVLPLIEADGHISPRLVKILNLVSKTV